MSINRGYLWLVPLIRVCFRFSRKYPFSSCRNMSNDGLKSSSSSSLQFGKEFGGNAIVGGNFRILTRLGSGSFGDIYIGEAIKGQENTEKAQVAIKLEVADEKAAQLNNEYKCYSLIGERQGFPNMYWFGQWDRFNVIVMDLLGKNLEDIFEACEHTFSVKTTIILALQLLDRFEYLHSKRIVYRDVKPENFCLGRPGSALANTVHLLDFGLSKEYADELGQHIVYREGKALTGTARYMSTNTHRGIEQSRRDDLEALAHLFIYFLRRGKLPWSGLKAPSLKERYRKIGQVKESTPLEELCFGFPPEFPNLLQYARSLKFDQAPNYEQIKHSFVTLFQKSGFEEDNKFEWDSKNE